MRSKEITFLSMRNACAVIFQKVYKYDWTRDNAVRFGQVECLRSDIISSMYSLARNMRPHPKPRQPILDCPAMPLEHLPTGLRQKQVNLQECLVGLMHTLVLNLGRHLVDTIRTLLQERRMWDMYRRESLKVLKSAQSLSIDIEKPRRRYDMKVFYESMAFVKTKLQDKNEKEKSNRWTD